MAESSSFNFDTLQINSVLISQGLSGFLPFVFYGEEKFAGDASQLIFNFRTSRTQYFDYSGIFSPPVSTPATNTTYLPETEDSKNVHSPIFFVDLITDDKSGVSQISARATKDRYEKRLPKYTFVIPKFTWSNSDIKGSGGTVGLTGSLGTFWIGTGSKNLYKVEYTDKTISKELVSPIYSEGVADSSSSSQSDKTKKVDSEIHEICFNKTDNSMYLTCYDHLRKYVIDNYLGSSGYSMQVYQNAVMYNQNKKIVYASNDIVLAVNQYYGIVYQLDPNTLNEISALSGFDSPFKIVKSNYHNCFFVAGTNFLWKMTGNSVKAIYSINGYRISDIDVTINGEIAITLNGIQDSIFRVIDKNLYAILFETIIDNGNFRFCKYCNGNIYAIAQLDSGTYDYSLSHYVYDLKNKTILNVVSNNNVQNSQSSSSPGTAPTDRIEVVSPVAGDAFIYGQKVTLKWRSSETKDKVIRIDLYKDDVFYTTIIDSTENTGSYDWEIPSTIDQSNTYRISFVWLSTPPTLYNSSYFTIDSAISSSSALVIPLNVGNVVGVDYDDKSNNVIVVVKEGYLGFFDLIKNNFTGLIDLQETSVNCMAVKNVKITEFDKVTKVRIFIGSQKYLNDKWDSGEVDTELTSMYYGGGNNLMVGETYYMNIQVYSVATGWSEVQTRQFIMPGKDIS